MIVSEEPVVFQCRGEQLMGILHLPDPPYLYGVLIVVGGPQTRVGSHRQFLLLARSLASRHIPVLRFDYRGMGDSGGEMRGFEYIEEDIAAAIDTFFQAVDGLQGVVLWGLCDAASAIMMYAHTDSRVRGIVLANPWVRSDATLAKAHLRHYYLSRLLDADFWKKVARREFDVRMSVGSMVKSLRSVVQTSLVGKRHRANADLCVFTDRMRRGFAEFEGWVLFILSGNDLTAAEFNDFVAASRQWQMLIRQPEVTVRHLSGANHTFSSREWRNQVAEWTSQSLQLRHGQ